MLHAKFAFPVIIVMLVGILLVAANAGFNHTANAAPNLQATDDIPTQMVPSNWPLIPSGLGPGDSFRLMFVTQSTTDGTTNDIGRYNSFVQTQAKKNSEFKPEIALYFRALVSVYQGLDARGNTLTRSFDPGASSPIYWVGGEKVADNYADFYDGSWDSRVARTATGLTFSNEWLRVHTGSTYQGTTARGTHANNLGWDLGLGSPPAWWAYGVRKSAYGEIGSNARDYPGFEIQAGDPGYHNSSRADAFYGVSPLFKVRNTTGPQPTISGPSSVGHGSPFDLTITFPDDAQINGMALSDLTVVGGAQSNLRHIVNASGTAYLVTITPADAWVGYPTIKVSMGAAVVTDVNGWSSVASNTHEVEVGRAKVDTPVRGSDDEPVGGL